MATIKVIVRKDQPDKNGECKIIILYRNGNETPVKHSIGEKVNPSFFDDTQGIVTKHKRAKQINYRIEQEKQILQDVIFDLQRDGIIPSTIRVKMQINKIIEKQKCESILGKSVLGKKESKKSIINSPYQVFEHFVQLNKNILSQSTISIYNTTLSHLKQYCINNNQKLKWELFDSDFYNLWTNYFLEEAETQYGDIGLCNSTIGKYFKTLKTFLNWAAERDYHSNWKFKKYRVKIEEPDIFPLHENQLSKIVNFADNEKNPLRLRNVASLFVFLCSTGMRFSDSQLLKWSDLYYTGEGGIDKQMLRITAKKTGQKLTIPLTKYSIRELKRYCESLSGKELLIYQILKPNNDIFDFGDSSKYFANSIEMEMPILHEISLTNFNKYIKEVGEKCGFVEPITIISYKGVKIERKVLKRWEKLSSHDCRRTFITLSLERGMRPELVMSITGHSSYKTMLRYNKISHDIKVKEFQEAWGVTPMDYNDIFGNFTLSVGGKKKVLS